MSEPERPTFSEMGVADFTERMSSRWTPQREISTSLKLWRRCLKADIVSRLHRDRWIGVLMFLLALGTGLGCGGGLRDQATYRFVDHQAESARVTWKIDDTVMPVLPPAASAQSFSLPDWGGGALLYVHLGVAESIARPDVLFEIFLENSGNVSTLLRERGSPGHWTPVTVPIPAGQVGGTLTFRRTVREGSDQALERSAWGNPFLLRDTPEKHQKPNILLVSFDTLRADRLGCYGNDAGLTPTLDRLAREGVTFERAYSPSTWTLPSHRSILSGQFPFDPDAPSNAPLSELLKRQGYVTAGFTGGGFVSEVFGFERGFDNYYSYPGGSGSGACPDDRFDAEEVFRRTLDWITVHREAPFFLFLHTYEVHDTCPFLQGPGDGLFSQRPDPGPAGRQRQLEYYDGLVAKLDHLFDAYFKAQERIVSSDNLLLVVTSDHGEGFWEHGMQGHGGGRKAYEELGRVPLLVRWPARVAADLRVERPVSNAAIPATILALLDQPRPRQVDVGPLPGLGLQLWGSDFAAARFFEWVQKGTFPEFVPPASWFLEPVYVYERNLLTVRTARYKHTTSRIDPNQKRIFDMASDPGETRNIRGQDPRTEAWLDGLAAAFREKAAATRVSGKAATLDDAARERLRGLGYLQ